MSGVPTDVSQQDDIFNSSLYRANVGIMLVNKNHQILAGEAWHYPGEWMMPQGGIDQNETPSEAMQRELKEETSLEYRQTSLLKIHEEWLGYRLSRPLVKDGHTYVGQRQKWFLLHYDGAIPDASLAADQEFREFDWVDIDWLIQRSAPFKRPIYQQVFNAFQFFFP